MTTRTVKAEAGWRWLVQAINLGRNDPKAVFGAIALVALAAVAPSVVQTVLQRFFGLGAEATTVLVGAIWLLSMTLYPLLFGGMLQVIDAAEHGRPTRASAVFAPFRAGSHGLRLVGFGVLSSLLYLAAFMLVVAAFGKDFIRWYWELITAAQDAQQDGAPPAALAKGLELPENFAIVVTLSGVLGLFLGSVYAIGLGQVAIAGRSIGAALADGIGGALKNLLPLLVLALLGSIGMFALMMAMGMVMLLGGVLSMLSTTLAMLLMLPLYFGILLLLYVLMFGVMYFMWRDICGEPAAAIPPNDRVEL